MDCILPGSSILGVFQARVLEYPQSLPASESFPVSQLLASGGQSTGHCTGDRDQDHPHGKDIQKSKMAKVRIGEKKKDGGKSLS